MSAGRPDVVVIGAGVAGLNAALALQRSGAQVRLLERRPYVGGRAYSYPHPALEEVVDSQHVLLGCCTNLLDFCREAGVEDRVRWYDRQVFLEAGRDGRPARASEIAINGLPAPFQYADSFLKLRMLTLPDKAAIARGLLGLAHGRPGEDRESIAAWYVRTGQTDRAIQHFWEPIVLATLNDQAANCSMRYGAKVFYELFLKTREGGRLGIPTVPLTEFYDAGADRLRALGGSVETRASVDRLEQGADGCWTIGFSENTVTARDVVLALPFEQTERLLNGMILTDGGGESIRADLLGRIGHFVHSPFISVLLWFDREITELDHAWLLDTTIQWFFHKSRIRRWAPERGSYVELVIAGSKRELPMSRPEILGLALAELQRFFPEAGRAKLVKSGILKEARATFSVTPGLDPERPPNASGLPGLYLAGDWTRTGWPSTMEGAARSGRQAAGAVLGRGDALLVPELSAEGLMRLLNRL